MGGGEGIAENKKILEPLSKGRHVVQQLTAAFDNVCDSSFAEQNSHSFAVTKK